MAATVDTESVETEVLILRATGDERISYLQKYPTVPYEDSFALKIYKRPLGVTDPTRLIVNTDFVMDDENATVQYLTDFSEDDYVYIQDYEYETIYHKYISSLRDTVGDNNFINLRYGADTLIRYFHKAIFEKIVPVSDWVFTLDEDVSRVEESIDNIKLDFIVDFAALMLQRAELKTALRRAIVISDATSRLDTTKHLKIMQDQVIKDEETLAYTLDQYLITSGMLDGSLLLAIKGSIKARTIIDYAGNAILV